MCISVGLNQMHSKQQICTWALLFLQLNYYFKLQELQKSKLLSFPSLKNAYSTKWR